MTTRYGNLAETYEVAWATTQTSRKWVSLLVYICREWPAYITEPLKHWSRVFEYDWILDKGDFRSGQRILDAGGGATPLQYLLLWRGMSVMNADKDISPIWPEDTPHHALLQADLAELPLNDNYFDRVICASVLEHTDNPVQCLQELWRVLKPGGRLIVTLDVADPPIDTIRLNEQQVADLVQPLDITLPPEPKDILRHDLGGLTNLKVLCFYRDKQIV